MPTKTPPRSITTTTTSTGAVVRGEEPRKQQPKTGTANRLRYLRERGKKDGRLWLTMAEVARMLNISESGVHRHETAGRQISAEDAVRYASLYKCETHELFLRLSDDA